MEFSGSAAFGQFAENDHGQYPFAKAGLKQIFPLEPTTHCV